MNIELNRGRAKYSLEQDKYQFILKKWRTPEKKKKNGEKTDPYWENIGYYSTIKGVASRLFFEGFLNLENKNNILEAVKEAEVNILSALEKVKDKIEKEVATDE